MSVTPECLEAILTLLNNIRVNIRTHADLRLLASYLNLRDVRLDLAMAFLRRLVRFTRDYRHIVRRFVEPGREEVRRVPVTDLIVLLRQASRTDTSIRLALYRVLPDVCREALR